MCFFSFPSGSEGIFSARCCRVLITLSLCFRGWYESKKKVLSWFRTYNKVNTAGSSIHKLSLSLPSFLGSPKRFPGLFKVIYSSGRSGIICLIKCITLDLWVLFPKQCCCLSDIKQLEFLYVCWFFIYLCTKRKNSGISFEIILTHYSSLFPKFFNLWRCQT